MKLLLYYFLITKLYLFGISARDPVDEQLSFYNKTHTGHSIIETRYGVPVPDITSSLIAGPKGPMLLQDVVFLDVITHFARERIPERVVHARGSGAFGYFEVTKDITKYTKAKVFESIGKKTKIAVRFSMATNSQGSPETLRDDHGFAIKFYTEDGIWDIVGHNSPIFFVRDALFYPMLVHAFLRNPVTNIKNADAIWDFVTQRPEVTPQMLRFFSSSGLPDGYRYMDGYGINTFKMVNKDREAVYVKFYFPTEIGVKNMSPERAASLASSDPDYMTRDLYDAIATGHYPCWKFYIQVMTFKQAETFRWNPFDATKFWPEDEFPFIEVGKFVLNENPTNYFMDVEQIGFSPSHMIPGIEPSPDKLLQGRLFAYADTQRYRLGTNYLQLPVNCPFSSRPVTNYQRDGPQAIYNQNGAPNYYPNSFGGPVNDPSAAIKPYKISGDVERYNTSDDDNFSQATMYWNSVSTDEQDYIVETIALYLKGAQSLLQTRAYSLFSQVNDTLVLKLKKRMMT